MSTTYPKLYQKSILFEVINKNDPSQVLTAFTLTIPPDSYKVVQGQRVSRTKTFGGMFIDDYGLDTAKITISGTTGNNDTRGSYIPGNGGTVQYYTGKTAIYALRDKIARYKNLITGSLDAYEMRIYDLSTVSTDSTDNNGNFSTNASTDGWVVSLDDFTIERSKDRPLWYNYSIEMVGLFPLPKARSSVTEKIDPIPTSSGDETLSSVSDELNADSAMVKVSTVKSFLKEAVLAARRCVNAVRNAYSWANSVLNKIDNVVDTLDDLEDLIEEYIAAADNLVTDTTNTLSELLNLAKFPSASTSAAVTTIDEDINSVEDTINDSTIITDSLGDNADYVIQTCEEIKRIVARVAVFGKSQAANTEITLSINGENTTIYGASSITGTDATTLERLAVRYYNDPSLATLIAVFNGISNTDIEAGLKISIPQLKRSSQVQNNKIYSWTRDSNYGKDIALTNNKLKLESEDFSFVDEENNLVQAVNYRLNERLGKRLHLTTYGLSVGIGSAMSNSSPLSYILTNIQDTLLQDPRIISVNNISLRGDKDKLYISFTLETVEENVSYQGVL